MNIKSYKVIDLFCGCGGLSLGFQYAGFKIMAAFDYWDAALNIYQKNFSHPVCKRDLSDLSDLSYLESLNPDIIIGGPPCQDYSTAGHRDEARGRAALSISYARIVEHIRPKYFLMENVAVIEKSETLKVVNKIFKNSGYGLTQLTLDASKCGVPQIRKRHITFGVLGGKDNEAKAIFTRNQEENSMTLREYFGDSLDFEYYFRVPTSYKRRGIYSIDEPSMTIRGVDRPVPKGYKGHPADPVPLTSNIRSLTPQERSWIQTFPKNFIWEGSKTNINQMIGNAVPVKLGEYIANCIKEYINEHETC
ncbi:MAG: DNA cytosine methyltransferase [Muribaculaceae bacterium]|nr:DNA cytosine methyltransferase [Muribaculaceae bacterium]